MTGAELIGCTVYDADGRALGAVHDLLFAADGRTVADSGTPAYRLTGVECGGAGLVHRLGYDSRSTTGPWPLTVLMRRLLRDSVVVPWSSVVRVADRRIDTRLRAADLRHSSGEEVTA